MLKPAHFGLSLALFFCLPLSNAEAAMNKCTDGKRITYTNEPCEATGLSSAGPIKDAVTVVPATSPDKPAEKLNSSERPEKEHTASSDASRNDVSGSDPKAATIKPVSPLVNKMLNW